MYLYKKLTSFLLLFFLYQQAFSQDVGVSAVISPVSGCTIGTDTIRISVTNFSPFPVGGTFNMSYTIDGGPPVNESMMNSLAPGASFTFSFSTLNNFSNSGTYTVCTTVSFIGDTDPSNNTLCVNVINDTTVVGGTISGPNIVCASANSGVLLLSGNNNTISQWEFSVNSGGPPWNPVVPANSTSSHNFSNLTQQTFFRVLIDGGFCPDDYSSTFTVNVDQPSDGGIVTGSTSVCSGANSGQVDVIGVVGNILDWQTSTTGSFPGTSLGDTNSFVTYTNLTQSTYYQVTVQNGVCPPAFSSIGIISVDPPSIGGIISGGGFACENANGGTLTLTSYSGDTLYWMYSTDMGASWTPIANNTPTQPYFNVQDTTIYMAIVQSYGCPSDTSVTDTLYVVPNPVADAGPDDTIYLNESLMLNGTGGFLYNWSPVTALTDPNIANPVATPLTTTSYTLTVTNIFGCTDQDQVLITVIDTNVYLPDDITVCNFITRNNDGKNDVWNITGIDLFTSTEVMVFNNQGQIVFEQKNYTNSWDGTYNGDPLPDGSYFYVVKVDELDKTVKGTLTIISK